MTTTMTRPDVDRTATCTGDQIRHLYCCDPDRAHCGLDLSDHDECPEDCGCVVCVVCEEMDEQLCEICGAT